MNATLIEIGALVRTRPTLHADVSEVAAWYERKAAVLGHIADTSPSDRDTCRELAGRAREHATRLLAPLPGGGSR